MRVRVLRGLRYCCRLLGEGGQWYELGGVYLICDGGYHTWRIMQCPLKGMSDVNLRLWSKWIESVRKDVECTFGILKGRFRILKVPMPFHTKERVDNVFFTCCVLHNMLLEKDGKVDQWVVTREDEDGELVVEAADFSKFSGEDVGAKACKKMNKHAEDVLIDSEEMDCSGVGLFEVKAATSSKVETKRWGDLRTKLVTHFAEAKKKGLVKWLRSCKRSK